VAKAGVKQEYGERMGPLSGRREHNVRQFRKTIQIQGEATGKCQRDLIGREGSSLEGSHLQNDERGGPINGRKAIGWGAHTAGREKEEDIKRKSWSPTKVNRKFALKRGRAI